MASTPENYLPVPARAALAVTVGRRLFSAGFSWTDAVSAARTVWREPLSVNRITWNTHGGGFGYYGSSPSSALAWYGTLPGSTHDYAREVRDPAFNAVVSIALNWACRQLSEPQLQIGTVGPEGEFIQKNQHPMLDLLCSPNPEYDGIAMLNAVFKSYTVAGMAYLIKVGNKNGPPKQLWWTPYWTMSPVYAADGTEFIRNWRYRPDGRGEGTLLDPRDVVVVRFDLNGYDQGRTSTQPLWPILRSIFGDNEAETWVSSLLKNMGVPGHLLVPQVPEAGEGGMDGAVIGASTAQALEERWIQKFTGDRRGSVMVSTARIEAVKLGMSPTDMAITEVRSGFEARICAAIGIPPQVLHLQSGNESKTYANQIEARQAAYEDCLTPFLKRFALALEHQLLPDYSANPMPGARAVGEGALTLRWDYSQVPCMQENLGEKAKWVALLMHRGVLTVDDARVLMGFEPLGGEKGEAIATPGGTSASTGGEERPSERGTETGADEEVEKEE